MNILQEIEKAKLKSRIKYSNLVSEIHHILMAKYGWIPYNEFKSLPIPVVFELLEQIRREVEMVEREMNKKRTGHKRMPMR